MENAARSFETGEHSDMSEKLGASGQFFRGLITALSASIDGVALLDPDYRFTFLNDAHLKTHGYENPGELIGSSWEALYDTVELARLKNSILPMLHGSGHWQGEALGLRRDGSSFPQQISLALILNGWILCSVRDTSKEKREAGRKALLKRGSEILGESVFQGDVIDGLLTLPVPDFADFCILKLRPRGRYAGKTLVGTRESLDSALLEELKASSLELPQGQNLLHEVSSNDFPPVLRKLAASSILHVPLKARCTIGSLILVRRTDHVNQRFTSEDVEVATCLGTRAALAIENLQLFREKEEAIRIREHLMATVSHDLKNPLTAISINSEVLRRYAQEPITGAQILRISNNLSVAAQTMGALIRQLLEFERLRTGRLVLEKKRVPLGSLLEGPMTVFQPLFEKKEIDLATQIDPSLACEEIECDPEKITQVLSNLLGNALKFTGSRGNVTLELARDEKEIVFSIQDTGVGICPEELEHVFEIHWQAPGNSANGNGLGLAIAKGIVRAHGGRIWAQSRPAGGSTFSFSVPCPRAAAKAAR